MYICTYGVHAIHTYQEKTAKSKKTAHSQIHNSLSIGGSAIFDSVSTHSFIVSASFVLITHHEVLVFFDTSGGIPPSGDVPTMP